MAPSDLQGQFDFLICCIKHTSNGKPDFEKVARDLGIVTKGAAAKRYERMIKGNATSASPRRSQDTTPADDDVSPSSDKGKGRATPSKKRKVVDIDNDDDEEESKPKVKREMKKEDDDSKDGVKPKVKKEKVKKEEVKKEEVKKEEAKNSDGSEDKTIV